MFINYNVSAVKTNSQLQVNNNNLSDSIEKLSSGYKINKAADDPAGMAISRKMKTQIKALDQASSNANDGISVIQTAEGALAEVQSILQRMRELTVQAANDTLTDDDKQAVQDEINELSDEVDRISTDTEFNTKTLLDGSLDRVSYTNVSTIKIASANSNVSAGSYTVTVTTAPTQAVAESSATSAFTGTGGVVGEDEAGTISINGESITIEAGETREEVITKLRDLSEKVNINMDGSGALTDVGTAFTFTTMGYGSDESIEINCSNTKLANVLGIGAGQITSNEAGKSAVVELGDGFANSATVTYHDKFATVTDHSGFEMKLDLEGATDKTTANLTVTNAGPMILQVGANENQTIAVTIPEVTTKSLEIENLNVISQASASDAITKVDAAVNKVSQIRSMLGAYQNRLESAVSNLDSSSENISESLSRIEDVDMAEEMTKYTQYQVLVQASTSVLAQANERPQTVLSLLQS